MTKNGPIDGLRAWLLRKLFSNYWSLAVLAVLIGVPVALAILKLDEAGLTRAVLDAGLAPVASAETARDFAGVSAGVSAAFITLYFSITLIVLSLAASSLAVRLIDRWLDKRLVRVTVGALAFGLVISLATMLAIDADAPLASVPLTLVAFAFVCLVFNVALLAIALQDLGRTMFVDRSIASLQDGLRAPPFPIEPRAAKGSDGMTVLHRAPREGYVEGLDLEFIARKLPDAQSVRVLVAPGQHVMAGDPLISSSCSDGGDINFANAIPIDDYRSDAQGSVFRIRLLVEIAARALSPALNDFYTAITCADAMLIAMRGHHECWTDEGMVPGWKADPRIELSGQDFASLFGDPLAALRQAACDNPVVAIRLIENYHRLARAYHADHVMGGFIEFLFKHASDLADHASMRAQIEVDAQAIRDSFAGFESDLSHWREVAGSTGVRPGHDIVSPSATAH